jgi:hypothetical protein
MGFFHEFSEEQDITVRICVMLHVYVSYLITKK